MAWNFEVTDTFGGDANYSWVKRERFAPKRELTDRGIVRALKAFAGFTGYKARVYSHGDMFEVRPYGLCQVAFATWDDTPAE